ncbi:hypothetical protein D3H55_09540 [Bacillus salacetis]|uniref:Uncharacterized protein n=2 Tax=Bacillus salacetis TaxID=2315464 RepID=A0A3A1R5X4_9BACI|nr:hypothetical protein D3H55_09540 [Bacillus salacetis]
MERKFKLHKVERQVNIVNNFYPYSMYGTMSERMQHSHPTYNPVADFDQDHMNPYRMTGLNPLQMSGIDEDELMPMNPTEMYGMQQGPSTYGTHGMGQDMNPADLYGMQPDQNPYSMYGMQQDMQPSDMQQGQNSYSMYGMQPGMGGTAVQDIPAGVNPWQMSDMGSMNPYQHGMNTGQMGSGGAGNHYFHFSASPYGQQPGYFPEPASSPQFMPGTGNPGYNQGYPYGSQQAGAGGFFNPGQSFGGGSPTQGYGMPGGPFSMGPGMRSFW